MCLLAAIRRVCAAVLLFSMLLAPALVGAEPAIETASEGKPVASMTQDSEAIAITQYGDKPAENDQPSAASDLAAETTTSPTPAENKLLSDGTRTNARAEKITVSKVSNWPLVVLTLIAILALILFMAWAVRRFGGLNTLGGREMRVIAALPVGAREKVALIDVNGQQFLLGVTTQHINHLHTFSEPVIASGKVPKPDFIKKLKVAMGQPEPEPSKSSESAS